MVFPPGRAFTTAYTGLSAVLKNQCSISAAYDPRSGGAAPQRLEFEALWDTGATATVITQKVVDACGLAPTGMVEVSTANGRFLAETFLINIVLANRVGFSTVQVTKGDLGDIDVLIGMDIITSGDFAVSNFNGSTRFSFRYPSVADVDYTAATGAAPQAVAAPRPVATPIQRGDRFTPPKKKRKR